MHAVKSFILLACMTCSGCGALDESSDSSSDDAAPVGATLKGLWIGETEEQGATATIETQVLFYQDRIFILRDDEALIGTYVVEPSGGASMDTEIYTYNTPDTDNEFYVGSRSANRIELDALFATDRDLFMNFDGASRSGSITLLLDTGRVSNLDLSRVRGQWGTQDSVLYINDEGGFIGSALGCQWKGQLNPMNADFLALKIERKLCDAFNQPIDSPVDGFAFIDGESNLHFIAEQPNEVLWMQFQAETATTTDTTDTTEEATP
ncbi:MAG: hypothetical protein HWE18_08315 [Gammaproteobacteria bacterium]|nr:hypothetical protein [Gammaproteobacteria bacterium]